jgi:hypothetical protein
MKAMEFPEVDSPAKAKGVETHQKAMAYAHRILVED